MASFELSGLDGDSYRVEAPDEATAREAGFPSRLQRPVWRIPHDRLAP